MAAAASSGGEQIDDFLDRCIGTMIGRLEPAIGSALSVGLVVEAASNASDETQRPRGRLRVLRNNPLSLIRIKGDPRSNAILL
jgi:hypothetical protein